jgi:hypothetical protein
VAIGKRIQESKKSFTGFEKRKVLRNWRRSLHEERGGVKEESEVGGRRCEG